MLMIPPHVFLKQVNDGGQSSRILQNGTDVSAIQGLALHVHYSEDEGDIKSCSTAVHSDHYSTFACSCHICLHLSIIFQPIIKEQTTVHALAQPWGQFKHTRKHTPGGSQGGPSDLVGRFLEPSR